MTKTYFNDAVIGNSRMLGCLGGNGELVRMFWPNIDYPQHIDRFMSGIFFAGQKGSTAWLSGQSFEHNQFYMKDTNIIKTVCIDRGRKMRITQTDYVLADKDILVRQYEIANTGEYEIDLGFVVYSSFLTATSELRSTLFDFKYDALIHYRHNYYISISSDIGVHQFQLGDNAFDSAVNAELSGYNDIGMMNDGALSWLLGRLQPGECRVFTLHICASGTLKEVKQMINYIKSADMEAELKNNEDFWHDFLKSAKQVSTGRMDIDDLYRRSLLVFKLMADEQSGGLLAAPEIDEGFTRCGRYAYCWGRDAAFITGALDRCGLTDVVDKFYDWAVKTQDEEGFWYQRYHMDGNLAPSWGLQIDETGTLIWGMLQHYKITGDKDFLKRVWDCVSKGVDFLAGFTDRETGLHKPTYDLWEERIGEHAYSSAAVCAGIRAGAEIAGILGISNENIRNWQEAWASMKIAIENNLWNQERECFLRSIKTKLNPWGQEYSPDTAMVEVNSKGYKRDVTLKDPTVDTSLLGIAIPFDIIDLNDSRMISTVETIERVLNSAGSGGIKRYENDSYIGGNPWILTTLWVALYHAEKGNADKAWVHLQWAARSRTGLGLLPEQVSKDTGLPAWVIPLTWSHAMFVLVLMELLEAGYVFDEESGMQSEG